MAKRIKVDGIIHSFPDDATEDEINEALGGQSSKMESSIPSIETQSQKNLGAIRQQHPYLSKISEQLAGNPAINTLGNLAGHFNKAFEGTGLPNAAKGFFESNAQLIRGVGNLIPGVNIPEQRGQDIPETNPMIQQAGEVLGGFGGASPAYKGYQALEKGAKSLPLLKNAPEALQKILAGVGAGSIASPDNRGEGAALGGIISTAGQASKMPKILQEMMPKNPYKVIQAGYDKKKESAAKLFQSAAREVNASGEKITLPKNLISQILKVGPKTESFANFVNKAKGGDFDALRELQAELFHRGERKMSSLMDSDKDLGELIFEKRDKVNDAIIDSLQKHGLHNAAEDLTKARGKWKNLQDVYHSNNAISKLVGPNREVPSSLSHLKKDAEDINLLKQNHPEIEKYLKFHKNAKRIGTALGAAGIGGGLTTAYHKVAG